jgi:hypothetical protein
MRISLVAVGVSFGLVAALGCVDKVEKIAEVGTMQVAAADEPKQEWGTIKGRAVWGEKEMPEVVKLKVEGQDKDYCLSKGAVVSEEYIVDPKTQGVKNVVVWLMDVKDPKKGKLPIHPNLAKSKQPSVTLDQPCCAFEPHVLAMRDDQSIVINNSAEKPHNVHFLGGLEFNQQIPAGGQMELKNVKPSGIITNVQCDIHGFMKAKLLILPHPYFAVTGADGKFEIKNVPAGKYRLAMWHEGMGWVAFDDPETPKNGKLIEIKPEGQVKGGGETDLGEFKVMKSKD